MKRFALALRFALAVPSALFAQGQAAPEIPFDSVPNFLKLPPNMYLGETAGVAVNSKGHIFVFSRGNSTGPAYGASAAQLLSLAPTARTSARSDTISTHGRSRTQYGSTKTTTSGSPTKAPTW